MKKIFFALGDDLIFKDSLFFVGEESYLLRSEPKKEDFERLCFIIHFYELQNEPLPMEYIQKYEVFRRRRRS